MGSVRAHDVRLSEELERVRTPGVWGNDCMFILIPPQMTDQGARQWPKMGMLFEIPINEFRNRRVSLVACQRTDKSGVTSQRKTTVFSEHLGREI